MTEIDLSEGARLVYLFLDEYARSSDVADPSQEVIARRLGMPVRTVRHHLLRLSRAQLIRKQRKAAIGGRNEYVLLARGEDIRTRKDRQPIAGPDRQPVAGPSICIKPIQREEETPTPFESFGEEVAILTARTEIGEAYDRHLKHRREEPRETVILTVMQLAGAGRFDWDRFRDRHPDWCRYWDRAGWRFCSLTFLAWVRCGLPPAPAETSSRGKDFVQDVFEVMQGRISRGEKPL